ncbi:MAG: hypothetical protein HYW90_00735 [Candidatus Sungbacteria bacterium]|nr:hypothetical protein [Candidatus Sungbacteria bacterium]
MNPESPGSKEAKPKHGAVRLFFEMDKKNELSLKEKIKQAKGLIRVFIHPDFERYSGFESIKEQPEDVEKLRQEEQIFRRILSSESTATPPIFIFEDGWESLDYQQKEERLERLTANDLFLVRTYPANPDPLPLHKKPGSSWRVLNEAERERREEDITFMWQWLAEELKKLGVKKILIGGLEFYVTGDKDKSHSGCMGIAMNKLKKYGFDVEISALTWPDKR